MTSAFRSDLLETYRRSGTPLATVYLPTRSDTESAEQRMVIHRDNIARTLRDKGATDSLVDRVASHLDDVDHVDGVSHLVVASEHDVVLSAPMIRPLAKARCWVEPVPMLVPLIGATQVDREHVAALLDRSGADVMLRDGAGAPLDTQEVDGPYGRLHRSAPGGWSQKRFQQTAENAWEFNAREVIDQILEDYPEIGLIICGGDERAVGFFTARLPEHVTAVVVDGSRHADVDAFLDGADTALRDIAATAQVDLLDNFRTAGGNGNAAQGHAVLDLLVQGRVSDVLVTDNSLSNEALPTVEFDFASNVRATKGHRSDTTVTAPLIETAVAQAVATGAQVHVVSSTSDTEDGLAAILRF